MKQDNDNMKEYVDEVLTIRRKSFPDEKVSFESYSWKDSFLEENPDIMLLDMGPWKNTLYVYFMKSHFENLTYPELNGCTISGKDRFDYFRSSLAEMSWHGGITFYQERKDMETGEIIVKAGCDYMHYGDESYSHGDFGSSILRESHGLLEELIELNKNGVRK